MQLLILVAVVIVVLGLGARSLWDRFKGDEDEGIKEWMLACRVWTACAASILT